MPKSIFVTGGSRSGKSSYALGLADRISGRRAFLATMQPLDDECAARIAAHKAERGPRWESFEEPTAIVQLINRIASDYDVIVLDCLTLWLSNMMYAGMDISASADELARTLKRSASTIIAVTNEVGSGIVPDSALARAFRDRAGELNRKCAAACDEAWLVVSGIPIKIK